MSAHSSGRLQLWTSNSWRRFHTDGHNGRMVCEPTTQRDGHPDLHFPNGGPDGPDARRMLATWNACIGISTETLELVPRFSEAGVKTIQTVEAERDELVKALRDVRALINRPEGKCYAHATDLIDAMLAKYPEPKQ